MTGLEVTLAVLSAVAVGGLPAWFLIRRQGRLLDRQSDKALADTTAALTAAAASMVTPLTGEVATLRTEVVTLRTEVATLRTETDLRDALAATHEVWDHDMERLAARHGLDHPTRPPLRPALPVTLERAVR